MTKRQQRAIVRGLHRGMLRHLLKNSSNWPKEWDGHELRRLCAQEWGREVTELMQKGKRLRAFRNACYNLNIP